MKQLTYSDLYTYSLEDPILGNILYNAADDFAEAEYNSILDKVRPFTGRHDLRHKPFFFLVDYFIGAALFHKELRRETRHEERIDRAIRYLQKSLQLNPDYVDTHMVLGFAWALKGHMSRNLKDILLTAKEHFDYVMAEGEADQKEVMEANLWLVTPQVRIIEGEDEEQDNVIHLEDAFI